MQEGDEVAIWKLEDRVIPEGRHGITKRISYEHSL